MYLECKKKKSLKYLFKKGRRKRLANLDNIPSEFFYGYKELSFENGFKVDFLEQSDLDLDIKNNFLNKVLNLGSRILFNLPLKTILGIVFSKRYKKFERIDFIVATTNSIGIAISIAKSIGLINSKILFINMGLFSNNPGFLKLTFYRYLFKKINLLTISNTEFKILNSLFCSVKVRHISFGVDENFWFPQDKVKCNPYVLSIGNDLARDWETLVRSWDENFPTLKIITSLPVISTKKNIQVIKGDWHSQSLSDEEMRDLYRDCEFVILPLKETFQPSGQSTCLQAMACSKAVLISNINGIWDRRLLKHKENIFFVKPCDNKDLNKAIRLLFTNYKLRKKLEINGRKLITDHFNITNMKNNLKEILEED